MAKFNQDDKVRVGGYSRHPICVTGYELGADCRHIMDEEGVVQEVTDTAIYPDEDDPRSGDLQPNLLYKIYIPLSGPDHELHVIPEDWLITVEP